MIDTHAHLDFKEFNEDRAEVIARFFKESGKAIVTVGVNKERNEKAVTLAQKNKAIFASLAYHPEEAEKISPQRAEEELKKILEEKINKNKVVAIGETGLDYFHNTENKLKQKILFEVQLELAKKYKLPTIIHCREAYEDVYNILKTKNEDKKVIHCYGGNIKQTKKFLELANFWFSFTGNITFEKNTQAEIFEVVKMISLKKIMVETDAPFLAPVPYRGKRNEPVYVKEIIKKIAEIKKMDFKKVETITDQNAINFFKLNI